MAITFNNQEAKMEKKATVYDNFTYDTESNNGCLNKFIELSKAIENVSKDVSEIGGKYNVLQSKYGKFTDFNEKMNANKTSLLASVDSIKKAYDQIITNLDNQVAYFSKNDASFMGDLESINSMMSTGGTGSTGGGGSAGGSSAGGGGSTGGGGSFSGGETTLSGGSNPNGGEYNTIPSNNHSSGGGAGMSSENPNSNTYSTSYGEMSNNSQNGGQYEDISSRFADMGGVGAEANGSNRNANAIVGDVVINPGDAQTGTSYLKPDTDPIGKYMNGEGFNGFAGVPFSEIHKTKFITDENGNQLPVGGIIKPEMTYINPDSTNGAIVDNAIGGVTGPNTVILNDIVNNRTSTMPTGIVGGTVESKATLAEGVSLNDIVGGASASAGRAEFASGNRITGDAYIDIR